MTRREFIDSLVGTRDVLWLDKEELRDYLLKTFDFADRSARRDIELVRLLRESQINGGDVSVLEEQVDSMVEQRLKFYNRKRNKKRQ